MNPLHVNYVPKLWKSRQRLAFQTFFKRLQNHYTFLLWCLVALDVQNCFNTPYLVVVVSLVASVHYVYDSYNKFIYDLLYVTTPRLVCVNKVSMWLRDFVVQLMCCAISFWWIDDFHKCLPFDRIHQGYVWIVLVLVTMFLHVANYRYVQQRSESIVREAYDHVNDL